MWKKNGKGLAYKSHYVNDQAGGRHIVLIAFLKNGTLDTKSAESWQMLKEVGWVKVS